MNSDVTDRAQQTDGSWLDVMACPRCAARLSEDREGLTCPVCRQWWPIQNGVPRFLQAATYWGEVRESDAQRLIQDAERNGWREAVLARFGKDRNMRRSLLDWQRAAWVPLLGLDRDAVALDIGSGYGCISASLARGVKQVFSLEAVPERLELTRLRLAHEKLSNIQLVLASALDLPFAEASFDLVVVNGVLEWVGEWESGGSPRDVQIKFLKQLSRLVKPDGVMLVGIENRLSWDSMTGAIDHSGLPYTNLMPRRAATWWLRRRLDVKYRTKRNARREYRTYTYSEPGYRKLLGESGFQSSAFYWVSPAYNEPCHLVTTGKHQVADRWKELVTSPGWRTALKALAARLGVLSYFVPEFVIVARKSEQKGPPALWSKINDLIPGLPAVPHAELALSTRPFGRKSVIRVLGTGGRAPYCLLKTTTAAEDSGLWFERESAALRILGEVLAGVPNAPLAVPRVMGEAQIGRFRYRAEATAAGVPLAGLIVPDGNLAVVERCLEAAVELARLLRHDARVPEIDARWRQIPQSLTMEPRLREQIEAAVRGDEAAGWVQHGNFTAEKIFVGPGSAIPTVIGWEHLFRGGSPLYDVFTLLFSILGLIPRNATQPEGDPASAAARLEEGFFGSGVWADRVRAWLSTACRRLAVADGDVWPSFVQFLVFRDNAFGEEDRGQPGQQSNFLDAALKKKDSFIVLR